MKPVFSEEIEEIIVSYNDVIIDGEELQTLHEDMGVEVVNTLSAQGPM